LTTRLCVLEQTPGYRPDKVVLFTGSSGEWRIGDDASRRFEMIARSAVGAFTCKRKDHLS